MSMRHGRTLFAGVLFAWALTGAAAAVDAPAPPQTVVVGLDISKSNPLVEDPAYAARVAKRLTAEIDKLPVRSRLMVRTFGAYDSSANPLKIDEVISARARPETVAEGVSALVAAMPQLVKEGKLQAQDWTYIVSFMETMSQQVDCSAGDVRFILLTDGIEDSTIARMQRGASLPKPEPIFAGCGELLMLGVGQGGGSPAVTRRVQEQWAGWAEAAGFRKFTGLYDW
ncbi:hypothetical protein [Parvibaculum sp.]|uniref:hypothetical protein n=1 Tax=Parvibaculum sp. TaxID=2024848 RepID=UPI00272FB881|nr:hypothetical protein [Parvibaculum sp.]MDP1625727.1 hypothetical protein [Parvibaculum sp.]MDP2149090.1 hypothetical protein [Parvibaculum sp.]MDP3328371.1 hypothetical protein [Parvibaculum sp.]